MAIVDAEWRSLSDGVITPTWNPSEAERQWLPIVGPTAWLLMQLVYEHVVVRQHVQISTRELAIALGVLPVKVDAAVTRLARFGLLHIERDPLLILVPVAWPMPTPNQIDAVRRRRQELNHA